MKNILFYYGYPSAFNYDENGWDIDKVVDDIDQYDVVVFGGGLEDPNHPDHNNVREIISKLIYTEIYGYVTFSQSGLQGLVSKWDDLDVDGIFLDEAGYDFGNKRYRFNYVVEYIHNQMYANNVFVNSWNPNHIIGINDDVSYPNYIYNEWNQLSSLNAGDWYLLESCPIYNDIYRMYPSDIMKLNKCIELRDEFGINLGSVSTISNNNASGQDLYNQHKDIAEIYGLDGVGSSDLYYGGSSSMVKKWE